MSRRGWRRGHARALLLATLAAVVTAPALAGCSQEIDQTQSLATELGSVHGVSDSEVTAATADTAARVEIVLDRGLDADATLAVVGDVTAAADGAGWNGYLIELRRSLVDDDTLVVDETFAGSREGRVVSENWIRVSDALLGEVAYSYQVGNETITLDSGGAIGHDVAEASRIGYGWNDTTWRFHAEGATFVVSGRVSGRDVELFNRVQRSVASTVLPVPATAWRLDRRASQVLLDLEVSIPGEQPERISLDRWDASIRPLAIAALTTTRYPDRARWLRITDHTDPDEPDTFASWSSTTAPVKGRDRHLRGWDLWWWQLAKRV